jgi:exosortase D (VPLPA-CTERM-specific)
MDQPEQAMQGADVTEVLIQSRTTSDPGVPAVRANVWGPVWLAVALVAVLAFFWDGLVSLFAAWQRPEYSHGYIIPVIAIYLAFKRYKPEAGASAGPSPWIGLPALGFGLLIGLFGKLAGIPDIVTYGFLIAVAGFAFLALGFRAAARLWPAWLYLCFMLPLPNFIYWPLSIKLQFLSSQIGVALIKVMGVPVYLDGNIIDLGSYQLQVAEACSGLRYLFPLMSFGFLFAALYRGPVWHKCIIFLATMPITILMNSARIAIIGFLVNRYGIAQAEGFLHFFEGWVIFAICVALLFVLAVLLQRLTRKPQPISQVLDVEMKGLGPLAGRMLSAPPTAMLALAACITAASAAASATMLDRTSVFPPRERMDAFPMALDGWNGTRNFLEWDIERVLGADDYLMADFATAAAPSQPVNLLVSYYKSQTEGSGIHSPEVCIPAGGWEVSRWEQVNVSLSAAGGASIPVNRAIIQKGTERQLVYYWFEQRGRRLTNDYAVKAYTVWDSIFRGRSDGALIRVVTSIEGSLVQNAEDRLKLFLESAVGRLPDFVPP